MASIKERVHPKTQAMTWQVQIRLKGHKPVSKNFDDKREAEKWAIVTEAELMTNKTRNPRELEKWTIADVIDWYFKNPNPHRKLETKKHFNRLNFLKEELGHFNLQTLSSKILSKWINKRLEINKPATVYHYYVALKNALIYHSIHHDYSQDLFEIVKCPTGSGQRDRRFSPQETALFFKAINKHCRVKRKELKLTVLFSIETACRIGEMLKLTWQHVNIEERWIEFLKEDTKTKEFRRVPITKPAQKILRWLKKNTNPENSKTKRVFHFYNVNEHHLSRQFSIVCDWAKIEDCRYHDQRHEGTSRLYEKYPNLTDAQIALITGHKSMNMLLRYSHLRPNEILKKLG